MTFGFLKFTIYLRYMPIIVKTSLCKVLETCNKSIRFKSQGSYTTDLVYFTTQVAYMSDTSVTRV